MYSGDEYYNDEITSGPNLEDLHGLDWNEANEYAHELDDQGERSEEDGPADSPEPEDLPF